MSVYRTIGPLVLICVYHQQNDWLEQVLFSTPEPKAQKVARASSFSSPEPKAKKVSL